tara:strand:+ start:665 stop:2146 length:1482 start_codon:yes stop_codon:yes gene_type:complete
LLSRILLTILLLNSCHIYASEVRVGADEWVDYTNKDGTGIYFELLKAIYPNYTLQFKLAPFNKTIDAFEQKEVDIVIGVHRDDISKALFPKWYLDTEYPVNAFYNDKLNTIKQPSDLYNKRLSWLRGYKFNRYISSKQNNVIVDDINKGFDLLANQQVDAFIDYSYNLTAEETKLYSSFEIAPSRHIYIAFQHNRFGKALAKQFDKNMQKLRDEGRLATIFGEEYTYSKLASFSPKKKKIVIFSNSVSLLAENEAINTNNEQNLHFIFDELSDYEFEHKKLKDISEIYSYPLKDNVCFTDLIKTKERERHFIASKPISIYLGLSLYSTEKLAVSSPVKLDELLRSDNQLLLGTVNGRSYGSNLDSILREGNKAQVIPVPSDLNTIFRQLSKKRFNLLIEYPSEKKRYWSKSSKTKLYRYDLSGTSDYIIGYMMCNKSALNKEFLDDLNQYLEQLYQSVIFFDTQYRKVLSEDREKFIHYFNQIFEDNWANEAK